MFEFFYKKKRRCSIDHPETSRISNSPSNFAAIIRLARYHDTRRISNQSNRKRLASTWIPILRVTCFQLDEDKSTLVLYIRAKWPWNKHRTRRIDSQFLDKDVETFR